MLKIRAPLKGAFIFYLLTVDNTQKKEREKMQEKLRVRVKKLKVFQGVSYGELAELMEIGKSSFYNWVNGQYSLSSARADRLIEILDTLEE